MRAAGNDDAGDPDVQVVEMVNLGFSLIYNENFKSASDPDGVDAEGPSSLKWWTRVTSATILVSRKIFCSSSICLLGILSWTVASMSHFMYKILNKVIAL